MVEGAGPAHERDGTRATGAAASSHRHVRRRLGRARLGPQFSGVERRSPQLTWPSDHAWCVAAEVDFDSTLVGGSHDLITAVVADRALEALPIDPDGRLTSDTDTINDPDGARGRARYDPEGDTDRELCATAG
ncbi:MAG: hypothetical protein WKF73_04215 [Nocardioidaceae bacterium]